MTPTGGIDSTKVNAKQSILYSPLSHLPSSHYHYWLTPINCLPRWFYSVRRLASSLIASRIASIEQKLSNMREAERAIYSKSLLNYIKDKEEGQRLPEVSAELNALSRHLDELSIAYLLHTDTNLGRCCSKAIQDYLQSKGIRTPQPIEIQVLHGPQTFQRGLANLVRETAKILAQHRKVRVCATGGFKPEVALASILGFIAKAPVYYIHESFREEVHLPSLPIDWALDVKQYGKAIDTIIAADEQGIEKETFIKSFGRETLRTLLNSWLIEERDGRYVATEVTRSIVSMTPERKRKLKRFSGVRWDGVAEAFQ